MANETKLPRSANAIDYPGFIVIVGDFSRHPNEMTKAVEALRKHLNNFTALLGLDSALCMTQPQIKNCNHSYLSLRKLTWRSFIKFDCHLFFDQEELVNVCRINKSLNVLMNF